MERVYIKKWDKSLNYCDNKYISDLFIILLFPMYAKTNFLLKYYEIIICGNIQVRRSGPASHLLPRIIIYHGYDQLRPQQPPIRSAIRV